MFLNRKGSALRTIVLAVIFIPIIAYLLYFANTKNKEAPMRMQACQEQCTEDGFDGYEFTWGILGGPNCLCIDNEY